MAIRGSNSVAETMLVPVEKRHSEREAGCGGVEGEFSSGALSLRSWLHIQKEMLRRSSEMWNHGQGKEEQYLLLAGTWELLDFRCSADA